MKRLTVCLFICVVLAGSGWMARIVWAQTAETAKEKTFTITKSQLDKYVADEIAKAVAADRGKSGRGSGAVVSDEEVHKAENWHYAVFHETAFVIYTGPGQAIFHHYVPPKDLPTRGGDAAPRHARCPRDAARQGELARGIVDPAVVGYHACMATALLPPTPASASPTSAISGLGDFHQGRTRSCRGGPLSPAGDRADGGRGGHGGRSLPPAGFARRGVPSPPRR